MKKPDPAVLRLLLFSGALIALVVILLVFRRLFLPLILGFFIAYLFDPAVTWLEGKGRSRLVGIFVITLGVLLGTAGFFLYLVPQMADQFESLAEKLPEYEQRVEETVKPWLSRLQAEYPEEFAGVRDRAIQALKDNMPKAAERIGSWLGNIFKNLLSGILFLLNLIFVPVFAFYLLVDFPSIKRTARELVPIPYRDIVLARTREVDQALSSFLRGQLTIALILGTINATGLMILGVPLGLVIGLVAGLANMIPYMAIVVGLGPALLLSWVEDQSLIKLLIIVGIFSGAQLLEGAYLSPKILGKSVNLHPVWVLLSIIVFGSLLGFFGMLIAVPLAAVIQVFVRNWMKSYRSSRIYRGEPPEGEGDAAS